MSNVVKEMMIEYGITAEAAVERLAELGDLDRKARKENHNAASPDHIHDWEFGGDGLICWCGVTKGPANALPSAESFVARRLGRDAQKRGRDGEMAEMPQIPSFTVYVDCVGKQPTPGELCEAILDGLEGRFDEIIHVEVLPR